MVRLARGARGLHLSSPSGAPPRASWTTDRGAFTFELREVKDRLRIVGVRYRAVGLVEDGVEEAGEGDVEYGDGGLGVVGGVLGGVDALPPPPPPRELAVPAAALEASRVAGEREILPLAETRDAIAHDGRTRAVVAIKVCVDARGRVESATVLKSSGYPAYDQHLRTTIVGTWRYRPYLVNGTAMPVCAAVTLTYQAR
jgi:TonB family protein